MKKIIALLFLVVGASVFAASDFSIKLAPVISQEVYVLDGATKGGASNTWEIGITNYNFFDENNRFGCFETLSVRLNDGGTNFVIGAALGSDANNAIRFQGGLGVGMTYCVDETTAYMGSVETTEKISKSRLQLGFVMDLQMKLTPKKLFSPVIGTTFTYVPACITTVNSSSSTYYESYSSFTRFSFSPYISLCLNLR